MNEPLFVRQTIELPPAIMVQLEHRAFLEWVTVDHLFSELIHQHFEKVSPAGRQKEES